jgi:hypothetical protein
VRIFSTRLDHEGLGKFLINAVIISIVGIGQGAFRARLYPDVVKLVRMHIKGNVNIAQAVFLTDMGEHYAGQLMPALELFGAVIAVVFFNDALKFIARQKAQELGKHISFSWHGSVSDD